MIKSSKETQGKELFKDGNAEPWQGGSAGCRVFCTPQGCGVARVRAHTGANQSCFSLSLMSMCLSVSLLLCVCVNENKSWQETHWKDHFENLIF